MAVQTAEVEKIQRLLMFTLIHATGTETFKEGRESKDVPVITFISRLTHSNIQNLEVKIYVV